MMGLRRRMSVALVVTVLQLGLASVFVSANLAFNVQRKFGGRERSLSALKAHDARRHGRLLAAVDLPLGGDGHPTATALYFTRIAIGTPPKEFHVQVDTGSDILWVNCMGCENCPTSSNLGIELHQYDIKSSSTGQPVACDQKFCIETFDKAPVSGCNVGSLCQYNVIYGDGSSSAGYFVKDNIQLNEVSGDLKVTSMNGTISFGCGAKQSGDLVSSSEALDGILGFGPANSSMLSQLASAGKMKKMFAHCLDGKKGGGIFAIGEVVEPTLSTTPLVPKKSHYNVIMETIEVGGEVLQVPTSAFDFGGKEAIIDSGTTLAYLPDGVFNLLIKKVMSRQPNLELHTVEKEFTCFQYGANIDDGFPSVKFNFKNSLSLTVYPHDYLFQIRDGAWCIGWQNSGEQTKGGKELTLLGDLALSNKLVLYDLEKQSIGWVDYKCSSGIKVKDEQSGAVYQVGAHNLSSACGFNTGRILILFLLLVALLHLIH